MNTVQLWLNNFNAKINTLIYLYFTDYCLLVIIIVHLNLIYRPLAIVIVKKLPIQYTL